MEVLQLITEVLIEFLEKTFFCGPFSRSMSITYWKIRIWLTSKKGIVKYKNDTLKLHIIKEV